MKSQKTAFWFFLITILIIVLVVIYVISLGHVNEAKIVSPEEFKEDRDHAKRRHKRLKNLVNKQKALKEKLDKKFKYFYLGVRMSLMLLWGGVLVVLYANDLLNGIDDILLYSQFSLFIVATLCFLTFGTLTNLKDYIELIRTRTENWVYGKYVTLDEKIEANRDKIKQFERLH